MPQRIDEEMNDECLKLNGAKCMSHLLFPCDQIITAEDEEDATYIYRKLKDTYDESGLNKNMI